MLSQAKVMMALAVLLAPLSRAQYIRQTAPFAFPADLVNATVTVHFDGYNITAPFSNSSEPTVPWIASLSVRDKATRGEDLDGSKAKDEDSEEGPFVAVARIKLGYDLDEDEDLEDVDESWGYCAAMQPLFNISVPADEAFDPTCRGLLDPMCLDWLHKYVNDTEFCESSGDASLYLDINSSPWCQSQELPQPREDAGSDVPHWAGRSNLAWSGMQWHYGSEEFEDKDDTTEYDHLATRAYVLLASWGERNDSRSGTINNGTFLNGTVLCIRANETSKGSRSLQEIVEDDASIVGRRDALSVLIVAFSVAMMVVTL